jgi:hypothetical protein
MWLMTKHGMFSIVEKRPGEIHVRSRERADLENLVNRVPLAGAEILSSTATDYRFRIIIARAELMRILQFLGESLDYSNFKGEVGRTPDQALKEPLYHEVWQVFADAFGAYGQRGKLSKD